MERTIQHNCKPAGRTSKGYRSLIIFAVLAFPLTAYSQVIEISGDTVIIDYALSGSSSYVINARNSLILSPGFSYSPTQGNSLYALTNPLPYLPAVTPNLQGSTLSPDRNYIRTVVALDTCRSADLSGMPLNKVSESVQYYDGLGRLMQEVQVRVTPTGKDMVRPVKYDNMGRVEYNYLPYPLDSIISPGAYREDDSTEQYDFYQAHFGLEENDPFAYSRTVYENSPLNRVLRQGAPGELWQPDDFSVHTTGYSQGFYYETNTTDEVMLWQVTSSSLVCNSFYASGELFKNTIEDENKDGTTGYGRFTTEYKDKQGKVVLKVSDDGGMALQTYYIYDDFGLLRAVLPPKYTAYITPGNHSVTPTETSGSFYELGYYYTYDERKRMVTRKLPGADPVYMVYDGRDRLVLTQDGNQRYPKEWTYTKYDALNRPIITGIYKDTDAQRQTLSGMQGYVNSCYAGDTSYHYYEDRNADSATHYYTRTRSFPKYDVSSDIRVLTVNYYDDYYFLSHFPSVINGGFDDDPGLTGFPSSAMGQVKGLLTGTKSNILNNTTNMYVHAVHYYDDRYRLIQRQHTFMPSSLGYYGMISTIYDFTGKVKETKETQWVCQAENSLYTRYSYDHGGRLLETRMKLNQGDTVLHSQLRYNELGELTQKNLHSEDFQSVLQSSDYSYNIRGWLTGINEPGNLNRNKALFGMKLSYDDPDAGIGSEAQYNGNISAMEWKHDNETMIKAYGYEYDEINRLLSADYREKPSSAWQDFARYDAGKIRYDYNGNIDTLWRYGSQGTMIDQLRYSYTGNRLIRVTDAATTEGFRDGNPDPYETDYYYDKNGNMILDNNKDIFISYNYLNLPREIFCYSGEEDGEIDYFYDATGVKWYRSYDNGSSTDHTYYYGSFVYKGHYSASQLSYILVPEGMINKDGATMEYQYFLKDHLGNTRVVFSDRNHDGWIDRGVSSTEVLQRTDYYPFGMSFAGMQGGENKYLYNGKEMQDEVVGYGGVDWYDYGARMYDPQLGRFHVIDRFAEKYASMTPYQYGANNPISFIDINGDSLWIAFGENNQNRVLYQDGKLLNADGSQYTGEGVKITKKGNQRITNSFLRSVTTELRYISKVEARNGTDVVSTLQGSENNFTIAKGLHRFDPGTFSQPYLFSNQATYNMTSETGLSLSPFWNDETMGYSLLPADKVGSGGIIYWTGTSNSGIALGHELFHAYDANTGSLIIDPTMDARTSINNTNIGEIRASTFENSIRSYYNMPLRETYNPGGHKLIDAKRNPIAMPPAVIIRK